MRYVTFLSVLFLGALAALAHQSTQPATQPTGGFFGARLGTVNDRVADQLGLDVDWGVVVGQMVPDGPAASAGVQERDVIQKVDGETVRDLPALQKILRATRPGQVLTLSVMRGEEAKEIKVTLGTRPPPPATRPG